MNKRIAKKALKRITKTALNRRNITLEKQILILDQMAHQSLKRNKDLENSINEKQEHILSLQDNIVNMGYSNSSMIREIDKLKQQLIIGDSLIDKKENEILELEGEIYCLKNKLDEIENRGFFKRLFV